MTATRARAALPAALLVAMIAVLVGDAVAVESLRSKQQEARAAASRQAAVDDFRSAVRPIAEGVFDQVQPLFDATTDTLVLGAVGADVRADVFTRAGVEEALAAQLAALRQLKPPAAARSSATELVAALDNLASTAARIGRTPALPGTDPADFDATLQAQQQLDVAVASWAAALVTTFGPQKVPTTPTSAVGSRRNADSRAAWVLAADDACGQSLSSLGFVAAESESASQAITDLALTMRDGVERVMLLKVPTVDAASHERVITRPLRGVLQILDNIITLTASATAGAPDPAQRRLAAVRDGQPAFAKAASGLRSRGATVCARLYAGYLTPAA